MITIEMFDPLFEIISQIKSIMIDVIIFDIFFNNIPVLILSSLITGCVIRFFDKKLVTKIVMIVWAIITTVV